MANRYIYKVYFKNGCTYIGKHCQKYNKYDGYITSSSYYKKHKDLFERREILIEHLPDIDTLDIMESLCIMADICDNPYNVNYNRGAWLDPSHFDRGFPGPANGMYGRKMRDIMGEEAFNALVERQRISRHKRYEGKTLKKDIKAKRTAFNKKLKEINAEIRAAHKAAKSLPHKWYYNAETKKESYAVTSPGEGWELGRLPHILWPEERKKSYADKHNMNPFANKSTEWMEEYSQKSSERQKGRICYTNGTNNIYLMQGQDIPEGFYKGCIFEKTELYLATRTGRKKGSKNKWRKQ